jgi:uncharacterized protein YukE
MDNYGEMQVGETRQLTSRNVWEGEAQQEYQRAQELTVKSGSKIKFVVDTVWKEVPAGRKIDHFTITRIQ